MVFGDRHLGRNAIGRTSAGEDNPLDVGSTHRVQQRERAHDIVVVVFGRLANRNADIGKRREVHHGLDPMLAQEIGDRRLIEQIGDDQRQLADGRAMTFGQIVDDPHVMTTGREQLGRMRADVAGRAGNEYTHDRKLLLQTGWGWRLGMEG